MNRRDLDAFVAHYGLSAEATDVVLDLAAARPAPAEFRLFLVRVLQLAGVLSLAAGLVFFIAANWQDIGVTGRFALIQVVIVVSVALGLWKPPPHALGRYTLLMAFIATGALLALFGQTYQTGADVYELFLSWALLGLAFVAAGQWSVLSAAWLVVFNVALLLFLGGRPSGGWLWTVFAPFRGNLSLELLAPALLNLALWWLAEFGRRVRWSAFEARWVSGLALACAFGFLTGAGIDAVESSMMDGFDVLALLFVLAIEAALVVHAMRLRNDVFPLALTAASVIAIVSCAVMEHIDVGDLGITFLLALWLTVSSTVSGRVLMSLVREWRQAGEAA
ncbi:hypothetical protein GCM10011487_47670 [Steroidobacter agaridevorans]|uniref:DUF2157 domain-containing protein n=1 Tax=Steroidobacter agaridevorans TaxID=2695856 RepID=A0A829YHF6_9GAMM|nr:DUF2157 domain-containing protein [Steroidobacter agaridevorans]GFE82767.1 hypothetical protein GCM10011487_47670 [Steroidobacter agaridevorans]